ncbi:O-acetyl-ADP-ribose deacetylase [Corynebacterium freneyi]|uniref:O-acetyl-ADP-ribose deacetylase (Regulator of RNase III) n=1 Tax=Corynebacterium freneyi TaxID=134034 RepID=A0ABS4U6A1_9CORY|nr:O-acetyl-ADP-ribose deacetylase [Corynebacterium freneyi]MBP2332178.1 O-acetyl-ADP-ribose deacetylase (regulator of RNase III) [Corynebacterium freneyi]QXA53604.1 O-acetyl-ADP-ribose deacetylase [Corynebacterium freneyi]WJZ05711.1 O-acetyl-ADP-ribose deacetylase [Corynebacterium freneyi]
MKITFIRGDITQVRADAVVNAANSSLLGGGGVDGAIHRAAGPELLAECRRLREESLADGLPAGQATITSAYDLPAQWIIHAVGPNRNAGETDVAVLESAFRSALDAAGRVGARSVAVPAIGAGAYGWSGEDVAAAAHRAIESRPDGALDDLAEVIFVLFDDHLDAVFRAEFGAGGGPTTGAPGIDEP